MNRELVLALLRQRLTSPLRMALLFTTLGFPLMFLAFAPRAGLGLIGNSSMTFALILAAGAIGQDYASGVLQLLFARPVRRSEYVLSRWITVAGMAAAATIAQVALGCAILAQRGFGPGVREAAMFAGENALLAIGVATVLVLFSSLVGGLGDLAVYVVSTIAGGVLGLSGEGSKSLAWLARAGDEIQRLLSPKIELAPIFTGSEISWFAVTSYFSTVTLCLALAIIVVNRKEVSYASG